MGQREVLLVVAALTALAFAYSLYVLFTTVRLFTLAGLSRTPVTFGQLLGMRLRGTPVRLLVHTAILLNQRGTPAPLNEVERAYLLDGKRETDADALALLVIERRQPA
ncbi:MAG TPA: hypothetical protein VMZ71_14275 [Gemmataceae bacterium]|nr:hypothetical protein [Gemmataceae bacterium]